MIDYDGRLKIAQILSTAHQSKEEKETTMQLYKLCKISLSSILRKTLI